MRMLAAILVATVLLIPFVPAEAASHDVIHISSYDELTDIGTGLPVDGHYVLVNDIVLPSVDSIRISVETDADTFSMTASADGYPPDRPVNSLDVVINGERMTIGQDVPTVTFPTYVLQDENAVSVELDSMRSVATFPSDVFSDGSTFVMYAGSNISQIPVFKGVFDGAGHSITGIRMVGKDVALFSHSDGAVFRNLTLEGTFSSFAEHTSPTTYSALSSASALVSDAVDTTFERIEVICDVVAMTYSSIEIEQGGSDGRSFDVDCSRTSVAGGIVSESTGCDFISCRMSGTVSACVGSVVCLEILVDPTHIDTNGNVSLTVCGGLSGLSENDRFAYCGSYGRTVTVLDDTVRSTGTVPDAGFDQDIRCESTSCSGSLTGMMSGDVVFGCAGTSSDIDCQRVTVTVPGTLMRSDFSGALTGMSDDCAFTSCRTLHGTASASSNDDTFDDVTPYTTIRDCTFTFVLDTDVEMTVEGMHHRSMTVDGTYTVLGYIGPHDGLDISCDNGSAVIVEERMILNPEFDWDAYQYTDIIVKVREQGNPLSTELVVVIAGCIIATAVIVLTTASLRRL